MFNPVLRWGKPSGGGKASTVCNSYDTGKNEDAGRILCPPGISCLPTGVFRNGVPYVACSFFRQARARKPTAPASNNARLPGSGTLATRKPTVMYTFEGSSRARSGGGQVVGVVVPRPATQTPIRTGDTCLVPLPHVAAHVVGPVRPGRVRKGPHRRQVIRRVGIAANRSKS